MPHLRIGYDPISATNSYVSRMQELLSHFGEVKSASLKALVATGFTRRLDLIVTNWPDTRFVDASGGLSVTGVFKGFLRLLAYRIAARRVVFVRHNVYPHQTAPSQRSKLKRWVDLYERCFDEAWVHSEHFITARRFYVPHPLYKIPPIDDKSNIKLPDQYFVIFGRILPYKKIESLLAIIPPSIKLVICGSSPDERYLAQLRKLAGPNVLLIPRYISDAEAARIMQTAQATIITHAEDDMVASGSIIFAISTGAPILAVQTPFVQWLQSKTTSTLIKGFSNIEKLADDMCSWNKFPLQPNDFIEIKRLFSDENCLQALRGSLIRQGLL